MIGNIILWASVIWLPLLLWGLLRDESKIKKNIAVGVTIPYVGREDEVVKGLLSRFRKELGWSCFILTLIGLPGCFLRDFVLSFTLWFVWIDFVILIPFIPYVRCNRALRRLKTDRGWNLSNSSTVTVDTAAMVEYRWMSPWVFLPSVVLSLVPLIWERDFWLMYVLFGLSAFSFWCGYRWLYRNKAELVDENAEITRVLTQVRRRNWGRLWLICAWSFGLLSVLISLTLTRPWLMLLWLCLFLVVIMVVVTRLELQTRRVQEKLTRESGKAWYVDEDDKWLGGLIYYDPNDSRTIINSRVGLNSSVNLARPGGKLLYGSVVLLLIAMPFAGLLMKGAGNIPLELTVTEEALVSDKYTVPVDEIIETELLEALPEDLSRVMGTGLPNLLKGNFSCEEYGRVKLCLDPTCPPYLLVETERDTYLLGTRNSSDTMILFEQLN